MDQSLALRSRSLDEVEWLAQSLLERVGVTRVSDVTDLDVLGIPVYQSVRPLAARGLNTVTSGKGYTRQGARVSAMMEAIERRYCEPDGRPEAPEPYEVMSERMPTLDPRRLVPRRGHRWTPRTPVTWWPMHCLRNDVDIAVPAVAVFTPFAARGRPDVVQHHRPGRGQRPRRRHRAGAVRGHRTRQHGLRRETRPRPPRTARHPPRPRTGRSSSVSSGPRSASPSTPTPADCPFPPSSSSPTTPTPATACSSTGERAATSTRTSP